MSHGKVLIVDDDPMIREALGDLLTDRGFEVGGAATGQDALERVRAEAPAVAVVDLRLPDVSGTELLRRLRRAAPDTEVIVLTGHASLGSALEAIQEAAFAYLLKPADPEHLMTMVERAAERQRLRRENQELTGQLQSRVEELHETQDKALQAGRLATLGVLVSEVAHELNGPLNVILGFSDLLLENPQDPVAVAEAAQIISESATRATSTVRKLLAVARARPPRREMVDLKVLADSAISWREHNLRLSQIEVSLEVPPGLPPVECDRHQIHQVLTNLLLNAEQAIGSAGSIRMRIRRLPEDRVQVSVLDSGPGVPEDDLQRIFRPFFTTREPQEGTGLGLSICASIVGNHNGSITATNRAEGGLEVSFELPLEISARPGSSEQEAAPATHLPSGLRVLVVEDDPLGAELISRFLSRYRVEVQVARSGEEGLRHLEEGHFQAVVCDLRMPGIGGEGFYRQLQSRDPGLARRVVFVTGDVLNPRAEAFLRESGCRHLMKPFSPQDLVEALDDCLEGSVTGG